MTDTVAYSFVIPGPPRGKGRPQFARRGKFVTTYTDDKTASYENLVALACREEMRGRPPLDGPVWLQVVATFAIPASASKVKKLAMMTGKVGATKKPDLDKLTRAVGDAVKSAGVIGDDSCIIRSSQTKRLAEIGEAPGLKLRLEAA